MQNVSFSEVVERIVERDPRYHRDAYEFIREALEHTQHTIAGDSPDERHVTGQQLLSGIRDFAVGEFGPMTMTVFESWGIRCCEDFGELVFNLIDEHFLRKTDTDAREDFKGGYSFDTAFRQPFLPASQRAALVRLPAVKPGGV